MSKSKTREKDKRGAKAANRRQALIAIGAILTLISTCGALAGRGGLFSTGKQLRTQSVIETPPASFAPTSPSKEYIYADSRPIATEEPCVSLTSPNGSFFDPTGGEASLSVTAGSGCNWIASSIFSWITITSDPNGSGNGAVTYAVRDNPDPNPRQGAIIIGGQTFTITQDSSASPDCVYAISPHSQTFNSSGGVGSVSVTTEERCAWQATTNVSWITVTSGCCGIDDGTINFLVGANTSGTTRNGAITIGGQALAIKQKP